MRLGLGVTTFKPRKKKMEMADVVKDIARIKKEISDREAKKLREEKESVAKFLAEQREEEEDDDVAAVVEYVCDRVRQYHAAGVKDGGFNGKILMLSFVRAHLSLHADGDYERYADVIDRARDELRKFGIGIDNRPHGFAIVFLNETLG